MSVVKVRTPSGAIVHVKEELADRLGVRVDEPTSKAKAKPKAEPTTED